jgi:pyrroline-5-carboxylate reductase
MSTADEQLVDLDRRHDEEPEAVGDALARFDGSALSAGQLGTYAFLLNHVLGEKLGRWPQALAQLLQVTQATAGESPGLPLLRHLAVAARYAGNAEAAQSAVQRLGQAANVGTSIASTLVELAQLNFASDPRQAQGALPTLARSAAALAPSALDAGFAGSFNNVTNALYYATRAEQLTPALSEALVQGAQAAVLFWRRAGGWMQHERAEYLQAKIALRVGDPLAAIAAAEHGLAVVAANGDDPVEQAFLLQLLAAGVERAGQAERAAALRAQVAALATTLEAGVQETLAQDAAELHNPVASLRVAFIGGGNMASALLKGLLRTGAQSAHLQVVEPFEPQRLSLQQSLGVTALAAPEKTLAQAELVVLAVKPQQLKEACAQLRPHLGAKALIISVAAGIGADDIARWLGTQAIVRTMPNTPALIAQGVTGMAALPAVTAPQRAKAEALMRSVGAVVWFDDETQLDAVTAVSGSGPAYVFYFIEALQQAGNELGFTPEQARALALATFTGAAQLAAASDEPPGVLRERVTSKGGTTAAALAVLGEARVDAAIVRAVLAAAARAREMAAEFGKD